jgi:flagellar protein FliS
MRDAARAYRESVVRGASPVGLVVILYQEVISSIRKAQRALAENKIEPRTLELSHALKVIGHLQATLDFEHGGEPARNLSRFYGVARARILEANIVASEEILGWVAGEFSRLEAEWREVDRGVIETPEASSSDAEPAVASTLRAKSPVSIRRPLRLGLR